MFLAIVESLCLTMNCLYALIGRRPSTYPYACLPLYFSDAHNVFSSYMYISSC